MEESDGVRLLEVSGSTRVHAGADGGPSPVFDLMCAFEVR